MSKSLVALSSSPLRKVRRELWPNKSLVEVTDDLGINWQAWYLTECGCYEKIAPRIVIFLKGEGIDTEELSRQYKSFQFEQRKVFKNRYPEERINTLPNLPGIPLRNYWEQFDLSRSAFSKALCIQPATLYKLENGTMRSLSGQLVQALRDIGMTESNIEELSERTEEDYYSNAV